MTYQKKLPLFDNPFWGDLKESISDLCRDLITGQDVARIAQELKRLGVNKCSDSLLYKQANRNEDQIPSLLQFLMEIKITENCEPIRHIAQNCGYWTIPQELDDLEAMEFLAKRLRERRK